MKQRNRLALHLLLIACFTALPASVPAQQSPGTPSLDDVLRRLSTNYIQYRSNIPNFFCDEHAISQIHDRDTSVIRTITDSTFRLRRDTAAGSTRLYESRDVKTIGIRPAPTGHALTGPAILTGAFSYAPVFVTSTYKSCFDYRLTRHRHSLVIDYSPKSSQQQADFCPAESNVGRAIIDPKTLRIIRIENKVHNHPMPGSRGLWTWSIDFNPVNLDGQTFWLPRAIDSNATADTLPIVWDFTATYQNCHKLTVTSRILPTGNTN